MIFGFLKVCITVFYICMCTLLIVKQHYNNSYFKEKTIIHVKAIIMMLMCIMESHKAKFRWIRLTTIVR